jgi:outer membrane protein OmpA-like peptidoglycan-associated protein
MRRFIQSGQLSPEIREAVRKRMVEERTELRNRLAVIEDGTPVEPVTPGFDQTASKWVNDRRSPASLNDDELRLRINIFVSIVSDNRYSALDRANWNERLRYDRQELRARMLRERALREARLRKLNERIVIDQAPAPADDFDMAEANARELEDVLVARPRRQAERRYTIEDFERRPELRAAVPRIEIDTIRFGFNESFVREEEIDKLDKVAEIIERILIAHPDEVFLIEGHTDASGSDFYNLGLSRQRARAVMEALTTYYVIPARSIRTIGYGERFLKIPVPGPEAENRRVSVSRITDFLAEY